MELKSAAPVSSQLLITLLDTEQEITPSPSVSVVWAAIIIKKKKKILCVQYSIFSKSGGRDFLNKVRKSRYLKLQHGSK